LVEDSLMHSAHNIVMNTKPKSASLQIKPQKVIVLLNFCLTFHDVVISRICTRHHRYMLQEHYVSMQEIHIVKRFCHAY